MSFDSTYFYYFLIFHAMFKRLFSPTISSRLFDPMPLPRRVSVVAGRSVATGRYSVPRNRIVKIQDMSAVIFKRVPMYR